MATVRHTRTEGSDLEALASKRNSTADRPRRQRESGRQDTGNSWYDYLTPTEAVVDLVEDLCEGYGPETVYRRARWRGKRWWRVVETTIWCRRLRRIGSHSYYLLNFSDAIDEFDDINGFQLGDQLDGSGGKYEFLTTGISQRYSVKMFIQTSTALILVVSTGDQALGSGVRTPNYK
jgi:hypothetical protein